MLIISFFFSAFHLQSSLHLPRVVAHHFATGKAESMQSFHSIAYDLSSYEYINMFLKGYPLEAKTALKN